MQSIEQISTWEIFSSICAEEKKVYGQRTKNSDKKAKTKLVYYCTGDEIRTSLPYP